MDHEEHFDFGNTVNDLTTAWRYVELSRAMDQDTYIRTQDNLTRAAERVVDYAIFLDPLDVQAVLEEHGLDEELHPVDRSRLDA